MPIQFKLRFFDIANFTIFCFLTLDHVKKFKDDDDDDVYGLYQEPYAHHVSQFLKCIQQQSILK